MGNNGIETNEANLLMQRMDALIQSIEKGNVDTDKRIEKIEKLLNNYIEKHEQLHSKEWEKHDREEARRNKESWDKIDNITKSTTELTANISSLTEKTKVLLLKADTNDEEHKAFFKMPVKIITAATLIMGTIVALFEFLIKKI